MPPIWPTVSFANFILNVIDYNIVLFIFYIVNEGFNWNKANGNAFVNQLSNSFLHGHHGAPMQMYAHPHAHHVHAHVAHQAVDNFPAHVATNLSQPNSNGSTNSSAGSTVSAAPVTQNNEFQYANGQNGGVVANVPMPTHPMLSESFVHHAHQAWSSTQFNGQAYW